MKKKLLLSLLTIIFSIFFGVAYIYFQQEKMLFQKVTLPEDHIFAYEEPFKEFFLDTDTNARVNALYFYVEEPKGVILYFHGRGGNLSHNIGKFSHEFTDRGYDLFIMDYRGFGKSRGKLSEKTICHDADYCYDYLLKFFPEDQIRSFFLSVFFIWNRNVHHVSGSATDAPAGARPKKKLSIIPVLRCVDHFQPHVQ